MTQGELMRELGSSVCRCGRTKQTRQTFCSRCYHALPPPMRRALYQRIGEGYEEAYESAATHLGVIGAPGALL